MQTRSQLIVFLMAFLLPLGSAIAQMPQMDMEQSFAFGRPGQAAEVTKTIHIEANDQMRLKFDSLDIKRGDVVKFIVKNAGQVPHEFAVGDEAFRREHQKEMKQQMAGMAGMEHEDPNVVSLTPGETKTLIWRFDRLSTHNIIFACYVPGHYEAGMYHRHAILK